MSDTVLIAAAETLVSYKLGVDINDHRMLYNGSYVEVKPAERIDEQEPPYFDVSRSASEPPSNVSVCAVKNGLDWDFYVLKTSALAICSDGLPCIGLSVIEPVSLHTKIDGLKQAVSLACSV